MKIMVTFVNGGVKVFHNIRSCEHSSYRDQIELEDYDCDVVEILQDEEILKVEVFA